MAKTRVYELAKELKVTNKDLMDTMAKLGIFIRSHMSVLENGEVIKVRNHYRKQWRAAKMAKVQQDKKTTDQSKEKVTEETNIKANIEGNDLRDKALENTPPKKQTAKPPIQEQRQGQNNEAQQEVKAGGKDKKSTSNKSYRGGDKNRGQQRLKNRQNNLPPRQGDNVVINSEQKKFKDQTGSKQRNTGKGQGKQNKPLKIPKPPEVVVKDVPEKKRDRYGSKSKYNENNWNRKRQKNDDFNREERLLKRNKNKNKNKAEKQKEAPKVVPKVTLTGSITVQELAKRLGKTVSEVIKYLMKQGIMATINNELDIETAEIVARDFGAIVETKVEKPITELEDIVDDPESLVERPPVVTVMGHVDHGKTSLLDVIRHTNVTANEAGGITQHIGAYQVELNNRKITFLDTPGHEAFTSMRARGAQATDIAILVVAADDGVMPQTIEAINHAKAAKVPIIVAINKIDRPNANVERVKQQLIEYELVPEEWGGDTIMVPVSAVKKQGINELLEMVLLTADIQELKANPNRPARGIIIEAQLDKGRGPVATMLVQKGTLKIGDNLVAGSVYGRVRAMNNDKGERIESAPPSMPVEVLGLSDLPEAGDIFQVIEDEKLARQIAELRQEERREKELKASSKTSLDDLFKQLEAGEVKELNLIIKADVQGSVEALRSVLERQSTDEVKVNLIHGGVGAITETDVMLAAASKAIIIGFNVRPEASVRKAAEDAGVEIRLYRVIYEAVNDVKAAMAGLLEPEKKEVTLGQAEVRATFKVPKVGTVAGCFVTEGKIESRSFARLIRDGVVIFEGRIDSLKRFKDDVKEVVQGYECGIGLEKFNDIKVGDIIEVYKIEEVKREL
ncbi:MAG: translation initiation factor [Clostridia bacterium]|nr:translation initiation factor [Clostridia bacterium]